MSFELSFSITQRHQLVSKGHCKLLEPPTYPIYLIQMTVALASWYAIAQCPFVWWSLKQIITVSTACPIANGQLPKQPLLNLACIASVSVRFRSKEQGTRVKDCAKNGTSKRVGKGWGRKEGNACRQTPRF